jgi:hypothetical protein
VTRLRYNNQGGSLGENLSSTATTIIFQIAPDFQTIVAPDYVPLALDSGLDTYEIVWLTAFTENTTSGTILRAAEDSTNWPAQTHTVAPGSPPSGTWCVAPTIEDFALDQTAQSILGVIVDGDPTGTVDSTRAFYSAYAQMEVGTASCLICSAGQYLIGGIQTPNVTVNGNNLSVSSGGFPGMLVGDTVSVCDPALPLGTVAMSNVVLPVLASIGVNGYIPATPGSFTATFTESMVGLVYEGDTVTFAGTTSGFNKSWKVESVGTVALGTQDQLDFIIPPTDGTAYQNADTGTGTACLQLLPPGTTVASITGNAAVITVATGMPAIPTFPSTATGTLTVDLPTFTAGLGMQSRATGSIDANGGTPTWVGGTSLLYTGNGWGVTARATNAQWVSATAGNSNGTGPVLGRFEGINVVGAGTTITRYGVTVNAGLTGSRGWSLGDGQECLGSGLGASGFSGPGSRGFDYCNYHHWCEKGQWWIWAHDCDTHFSWDRRGGPKSYDGITVRAIAAPLAGQLMYTLQDQATFQSNPDLQLTASGILSYGDGTPNPAYFLRMGAKTFIGDGRLNCYAELNGRMGTGGLTSPPTTLHLAPGAQMGPLTGTMKFLTVTNPWQPTDWSPQIGSSPIVINGGVVGDVVLAGGTIALTNVSVSSGGVLSYPVPGPSNVNTVTIASTLSTIVATFTGAHGLVAGNYIVFQGMTNAGYNNVTLQIASVTTNTITINSILNLGSDSGTCWQVFSSTYLSYILNGAPAFVLDGDAVLGNWNYLTAWSNSLNSSTITNGYATITVNNAPSGATTDDQVWIIPADAVVSSRLQGPKTDFHHNITNATKPVQILGFSYGDVISHTVTQNTTFQFAGVSISPRLYRIALTNAGSFTLQWPSIAGIQRVIWQGGQVPPFQSSGTDVIEMFSLDGVNFYAWCDTVTPSPTVLTGVQDITSAESGGAPTIAVNANAGTGATATVVGTDVCGVINLTTGTGTASGNQLGVTFHTPKNGPARVMLTVGGTAERMVNPPNSVSFASGGGASDTNPSSGFYIDTNALSTGTTYKWYYQVME